MAGPAGDPAGGRREDSAIELAASAGIITYTVQYETRNDGSRP